MIYWPVGGTAKECVNFRQHIERKLLKGDVYLVFDRYYEYSTKGVTRGARDTEASRVHQLKVMTGLPSQKVIPTVTKQFIEIICAELIEDVWFHRDHIHNHKLTITSQDKTLMEISHEGLVIKKNDKNTTHEEADIIIVQQMFIAGEKNVTSITVLSNDTDVFVLLLHYYLEDGLKAQVTFKNC